MSKELSERDIRTIENLARTGMGFDDLCHAFVQFPFEEIEKVYMRVRRENIKNIHEGTKINCS